MAEERKKFVQNISDTIHFAANKPKIQESAAHMSPEEEVAHTFANYFEASFKSWGPERRKLALQMMTKTTSEIMNLDVE
ncbi:hypothetical protein DMENIID0001_002780 [Sergentomyia squamirostris]